MDEGKIINGDPGYNQRLIAEVLSRLNAKTIGQALARGYCHPATSHKILDPVLIEAMTVEVLRLIITLETPQEPEPTSHPPL
jgi:hypothetical protein